MALSVLDFVAVNYLSLILLVGIGTIILLNKKLNIPAVGTIWIILGLVICIMITNWLSDWAALDVSRREVNYWALMIRYSLYPFIVCLEVFTLLDGTIKRILLFVPAVVNAFMMLVLPRISGFVVVWYDEQNRYHSNDWHILPFIVTAFYLILWLAETFIYFKKYKDRRSVIALLTVVITLLTMFLEYENLIDNAIFNVMVIDIYLYYFYLSTVYQRKVDEEMQQKKQELTEVKLKLLQEQLSPHFTYNALTIIKSLVYEDPEQAAQTIDDFSTYLRQNVNALKHSENTIPFTKELEHIKALQRIDEAGKGKNTDVIYDIQEENFRVPPLTIEPLFENALIHGISQRKKDGQIRIITDSDDKQYIVRVIDNGKGFDTNAPTNGVGISNIRTRLEYFCGGTLTIQSGKDGTTATVLIPKVRQEAHHESHRL